MEKLNPVVFQSTGFLSIILFINPFLSINLHFQLKNKEKLSFDSINPLFL